MRYLTNSEYSAGQFHYYHTTLHWLTIPGPHINDGGNMSAKHVSPDLGLIFRGE